MEKFVKLTWEGLPSDFGARLLEGKLFKIFDSKILPRAAEQAPKSVDKIITAHIKLLLIMLENELDLVTRLTTVKEDDPMSGLVLRLLKAMTIWTPNNKPTKFLQN